MGSAELYNPALERHRNCQLTKLNTVIPRLTLFRTCVIGLQTEYTKPSPQVLTKDCGDIFELLNSHDQEVIVSHVVEIQQQSALEEAEEHDGVEVLG
jgi:hypothetical protein